MACQRVARFIIKSRFFNGPRVHWMRNALAHVPKGQHTMVAVSINLPCRTLTKGRPTMS